MTAIRLLRRGEDGLTTLEWLLIVAAVASLAALAVVLVQNVVDDTAEQIGGQSARKTAANVAAQRIMADAASTEQPAGVDTWGQWKRYYTNKCDQLKITFGDAGVWAAHNSFTWGPSLSASATFDASAVDHSSPPAADKALAMCVVTS